MPDEAGDGALLCVGDIDSALYLFFAAGFFFGPRFFSCGAGVFSIFLTASSKVVGGNTIGLPWRPAGLGALFMRAKF